MRFARNKLLAPVCSILLVVASASMAAALPSAPITPSGNVVAGSPDNGPVIIGGTTQSTDPTAVTYVPPAPAPGTITPMDATGAGLVSPYNVTIQGVPVPVPAGYVNHQIIGSGLKIKTETAIYAPTVGVWAVGICNWRIDFQNRSGSTIYKTWTGTTHGECFTGANFPARTISGPTPVKQGVQCARLFVSGTFRGEQCHNVFP